MEGFIMSLMKFSCTLLLIQTMLRLFFGRGSKTSELVFSINLDSFDMLNYQKIFFSKHFMP